MNNKGAVIKVVGVGGGGGNAVNRMIISGVNTCEFISMNTDLQALNVSKAATKVQLGVELTSGLGAGSDPDIGKRAAEESIEDIKDVIKDTNLLFITAGMGGGTGTGAAPVVARVAKEMGILTVAVVTKPFTRYEGSRRIANAESGIEELKKYVDTLIVIPNEKVGEILPKDATLIKAFMVIDDVLKQAILGVTDIIVRNGLINLDFADIKNVLQNSATAHIGMGCAKGANKVIDAIKQASQSSLLETTIEGATGVILYIVGDRTLCLSQVEDAAEIVSGSVSRDANIIFGYGIDPDFKDQVSVTIIATGMDNKKKNNSGINPYASTRLRDTLGGRADSNTKIDNMYIDKKEDPAPSNAEKIADEDPDYVPTSRMKVDFESLPPFIKKIKKL